MEKNGVFTKILAIGGVVLVWLPLLAPILFSLARLLEGGMFRFDYLMPAELFPFALAGDALLVWAALRARARVKLIAWGLGGAIVLLGGSQALAVVSGLANGTTDPGGWAWALVIGALAAYIMALLAVGIGGGMLVRDVYKKKLT